jgi:ornithine cyclodeaminase/alanine dehydrogenase-like protein (mu-crystallin family)
MTGTPLTTLTADDVRATLSMSECIDAVRHAFRELAAGAFDLPTRTALRDGGFLVMPAHHRPSATMAVKSLSLDFGRDPAIAGTVVWMDLAHADHVVADAACVTALRTGAAVGVATDLLAPPTASRMTIIGCGKQAPDQIRAVHAVRPLHSLTVVDHDPRRADSLADAVGDELGGVDLVVATNVADAVGDADVVCCATSATEPLFTADMLAERVHVNAIGAYRPTMRELPDELLGTATVVVDERTAVLEESGEILHALAAGAIQEGDLIELGAALTGALPEPANRTVFKSVGVAIQDWAVARALAAKVLPHRST